jgi:predicted RNA-binding protein
MPAPGAGRTAVTVPGGFFMCEAHAFLLKDGREEEILENVDLVEATDGEVRLVNIFGEQKILKARFRRYENRPGKMVFEPV